VGLAGGAPEDCAKELLLGSCRPTLRQLSDVSTEQLQHSTVRNVLHPYCITHEPMAWCVAPAFCHMSSLGVRNKQGDLSAPCCSWPWFVLPLG